MHVYYSYMFLSFCFRSGPLSPHLDSRVGILIILYSVGFGGGVLFGVGFQTGAFLCLMSTLE